MKKITIFAVLVASASANAGWNLNLASGWRVVGGANYNSGLTTDLDVSGARALPYMPSAPTATGVSRASARSAAMSVLAGKRVDYSNGAFVDPNYSGMYELPEYTWNWYAPAGSYDSGAMTFSYDYSEVSSVGLGSLADSSKDERDMPGFTVEIQRNIGQWGNFGLDGAFGFNYFRRNDAFKSSGTVYSRIDTVRSGSYVSSFEMNSETAEWARNEDGSYGGGTFDGPGALLPIGAGLGSFSIGNELRQLSTSAHSMYLDSSADYEEIELTITAKPYYDVTEWFRVIGTIGVVVGRGSLDFDMTASSNGYQIYSESQDFSQWDCYGIGGLGAMLHYWHMCLGFDFFARFLDRDIDIDGGSVSGTVERCPWMFRVYMGFEF